MGHFLKVIEIDPQFCKAQVHLRLAEVSYKLNNTDEAFKQMAKVENELKRADKYMLHLLKGKCYDKTKQYKQACLEYKVALDMCTEYKVGDDILGQIYFRVGWS